MSPYNLGNKALDTGFDGRKQIVEVNGQTVLSSNDRLETYRATDISIDVVAQDGKGILIQLRATQGAPILNAIKLIQTP